MERMKDKVAIITGATSGIGKAAALLFARHGIRLVLSGRNKAAGEALTAEINRDENLAIFKAADSKDEQSLIALVETAEKEFGRLDLAFNNAGTEGTFGSISDQPKSQWDEVIQVNLTGVWLALKYQIAAIRKHGQGGAIVNTSSILSEYVLPNVAAYCVSKAGLDTLTHVAALECGRENIRINSVNPSSVATPMLARILSEEEIALSVRTNPMGKIASPEDVAETVLWLLSPMASHINGINVFIDGGQRLQIK